jgi:hypothetical protein
MKKPSSKLVHILIGKAIIEIVLVGAIAVGFNALVFPPTFHGWGEVEVGSKAIVGWAVNDASPWERVHVQLFIDGKFVADQIANLSRPDVEKAGWSQDQWHGYNFGQPVLADGLHEARVYAVHSSGGGARFTLQQLGDPISILVGSVHEEVRR